ncbi:MAG: hypothetical protein AB7I27_04195 [Bacteriovoracaceae bacterium]
MKFLTTLALAAFSISAFSQSYLILNNGVTLTLDRNGMVYDLNNFILPFDVSFKGAQYLGEKSKLVTVDEKGILYKKDEEISKVKGTGANYLFDKSFNLITIDSKGYYYNFEKNDDFKKTTAFGGKFFVANNQLYTITATGNYILKAIPGLNPASITTLGGNYFLTKEKVLYTISKDGYVYAKDLKVNSIAKLGGNFFVTDANLLYSISEDGLLILPSLPANFKLSNLSKLGSNFMLDNEGRIFVVDSKGNIFEREVKEHNLKNAKVLSI